MPVITYVSPGGDRTAVEVPEGTTVMEAAVTHGIEGIVAECGGAAMCATCHVYVGDGHVELLGPPSGDEEEMLDCTASPRRSNSRLGCQLVVTSTLDGLVVHLPAEQT